MNGLIVDLFAGGGGASTGLSPFHCLLLWCMRIIAVAISTAGGPPCLREKRV